MHYDFSVMIQIPPNIPMKLNRETTMISKNFTEFSLQIMAIIRAEGEKHKNTVFSNCQDIPRNTLRITENNVVCQRADCLFATGILLQSNISFYDSKSQFILFRPSVIPQVRSRNISVISRQQYPKAQFPSPQSHCSQLKWYPL